jgi:hypothetical protein
MAGGLDFRARVISPFGSRVARKANDSGEHETDSGLALPKVSRS